MPISGGLIEDIFFTDIFMILILLCRTITKLSGVFLIIYPAKKSPHSSYFIRHPLLSFKFKKSTDILKIVGLLFLQVSGYIISGDYYISNYCITLRLEYKTNGIGQSRMTNRQKVKNTGYI